MHYLNIETMCSLSSLQNYANLSQLSFYLLHYKLTETKRYAVTRKSVIQTRYTKAAARERYRIEKVQES